ncbi:MAG TPA: hypothetical protein VM124_03245 [Candidatus Limnocylindrales bacterium]|nr:hypothetical protein [Candidatus Limnocylindrales bacterium]
MPKFCDYDSLANLLDAQQVAVEEDERRARLKQAAAGQKLLTLIVDPCNGRREPTAFSTLQVSHIKRRLYRVEGSFPLEGVVIGDRPTLPRLVLAGTYRTLALRRQGTQLQEDPLRSLVPEVADLTLAFADLERPRVTTSQHWAAFNHLNAGEEATGFEDPLTHAPLTHDGNHYAGILATLHEALRIRQDACGV